MIDECGWSNKALVFIQMSQTTTECLDLDENVDKMN